MTPNQVKVLIIVGRNTHRRQKTMAFTDLEQALPIKFGFLMRATDGLREIHLLNGKRHKLSLTQRGRNVYNAIREVWDR